MRKGPRRLRPGLGAGGGELEPGGFSASGRRTPLRPLRLWLLLLVLAAGALLGLWLLWREVAEQGWGVKEQQQQQQQQQEIGGSQLAHKPRSLSSSQLKRLSSLVDLQRLWHSYLQPILLERYPGSRGSKQVQQFITERLRGLAASWHIELDSFEDRTPRGMGAKVSLQLLFLDGEEAFGEWSDTDSLYGARHLAERMSKASLRPGVTQLQAMALFVLLDLLGADGLTIQNHFSDTASWFERLVSIERRLHRLNLLASHPQEQLYFSRHPIYGPVQDDHVPFLQRGVPVLHLIATPFPVFWHTMEDTEVNLHRPTVENLCKILAAFVAEYLWL
ncbi:glutaminyl-peptide cyclotransferase-like protein isoform X2 [Eublepharis macularius]|uniref:glutaminyl-peptide cyclotransferase n=1 Tax=Eublepharis macularius TaxID=481883 RepID=A0AA97KE60_EUBMA|nr:glutaminyl-peptide cyclotransferase-like protein isoform X2 [Eublepharis macularius]